MSSPLPLLKYLYVIVYLFCVLLFVFIQNFYCSPVKLVNYILGSAVSVRAGFPGVENAQKVTVELLEQWHFCARSRQHESLPFLFYFRGGMNVLFSHFRRFLFFFSSFPFFLFSWMWFILNSERAHLMCFLKQAQCFPSEVEPFDLRRNKKILCGSSLKAPIMPAIPRRGDVNISSSRLCKCHAELEEKRIWLRRFDDGPTIYLIYITLI